MELNQRLKKLGLTKYRLSKLSGVPYATISDLCHRKTSLLKANVETLFRLAKAMNVSMETLIEEEREQIELELSYEVGLPPYLQQDLDAYKEGLRTKSSLMDCYWGELYGSINVAQINEGSITPEHAEYLRQKYLWRKWR
ncbi:MAG: helix-turn-helix transcriptional regulator [Bacilli bacterium]|nr:helix-turn-helix transcriptional regulator [Bacilli bacterium]